MHPILKTLFMVVAVIVVAGLIVWLAPQEIGYLAIALCFSIVLWAARTL